MGLLSRLKRLWELSGEPQEISSFDIVGGNIKSTWDTLEEEQNLQQPDKVTSGESKMAIVVDMNDPLDEFPNEDDPK